jgi:hypothetical protein
MQLNESTYETIFLLYIDKELSPKERLEVEAFIADNPNYALEMEALQATVLGSDKIQYPFKENLKQQVTSSLEDLEKEWNQTYTTILKADVDAIPSLSTSFKNTLKKDATKEGIVIKPFIFSQQKFTYAAVAACLMAFIGYQQLTKNEMLPNVVSPLVENKISNTSPKVFEERIETIAETKQIVLTKQEAITKLQVSNPSKTQRINIIEQASIAMAEPTPDNGSLINQAMMKEIPRTYNNPIIIDAIPLTISSANLDAAPTEVEKELTSYEIIDTEDPNRTIFIANFEIDGTKFRGLTRRVSALLKRNKSEKEK